ISIPLQFFPLGPGRYPCKILLTSSYDVRVYDVEGVVNANQPDATFEFETPAFEPLTQNIPINNETKKAWKCQVKIEGKWFYGPAILLVRPGETVEYPLTFKPILECEVMGKLTLQNKVDGMVHIIDIKGIGKKPLACGTIIMDCKVGDVANKSIIVPNYMRTILTFKLMDLSHRTLQVLIKQEIQRKSGYAIQADGEQLRVQLDTIQCELNAPTQFKGRLNELISQIRMQNHFGAVKSEERYYMDADLLHEIKQHLKQQQEGLSHFLISIIKDDLEVIKLVEHGLNETIHIRGGVFS
ncbi:Nucleoporin p54, partial [Heterocephalus glaber]